MALVAQDTMDSDTSDADVTGAADYNEASSAASSSRTARNGWKLANVSSGGDLRKMLLKSKQAKSTCRKTRPQEAGIISISFSLCIPSVQWRGQQTGELDFVQTIIEDQQ